MEKVEKLVIVGSGPAGLTAAIYAARGGLNPLIIAGREVGGQLMLTTDVDDFPGFPEGIQGPELMERMINQAKRFNTRIINENVTGVYLHNRPFIIKTESDEFKAESIIIATGASAKWLGIESEAKLIGKGVSSCAVCDGFFFKGKEIIVVGGGDTAMREVQYLSNLCSKVYLVHRRDELRAQQALQDLVKAKDNVEFIFNTTISEFIGEDKLEAVMLEDVKTGETRRMEVSGVFVAIGHKPNTDFLSGQLELDEAGYIKMFGDTKTSVEGVFWAGDVADTRYKQAVTAAGAGCKAAFEAQEFVESLTLP